MTKLPLLAHPQPSRVLAMLLAVTITVTPMFGVNHRAPGNVTKEAVDVANLMMLHQQATKEQAQDLISDYDGYLKAAEESGSFEKYESKTVDLLQSGGKIDVTAYFNELNKNGFKGDKQPLQAAVDGISQEARNKMAKAISQRGIAGYARTFEPRFKVFIPLDGQPQFSVQPQDCGDYVAYADAIMAFAAIVALFNPVAAGQIGAIGAALWLFGTYLCPYMSQERQQ